MKWSLWQRSIRIRKRKGKSELNLSGVDITKKGGNHKKLMAKYLNRFARPNFVEETITGQRGEKIGVIRIKPSSVLWKPSGERQFYSITIDHFEKWITSKRTDAERKWK
jgi:hypothetical protein